MSVDTDEYPLPSSPAALTYSEGVCGDGVAILCNGQPVAIEEIVQLLNENHALTERASRAEEERDRLEERLANCRVGNLDYHRRLCRIKDAALAAAYRRGLVKGMNDAAIAAGSMPTAGRGTFEERLMLQRFATDIAERIRAQAAVLEEKNGN